MIQRREDAVYWILMATFWGVRLVWISKDRWARQWGVKMKGGHFKKGLESLMNWKIEKRA